GCAAPEPSGPPRPRTVREYGGMTNAPAEHRTDDVQPAARGFASDNQASVHPEILAALAACNDGHQPAYGDDEVTGRLREVVRRHFGEQAEVYPVFNGTGANVVSLQAMSEPWSSVICPETPHVNTDECGAARRVPA